VRMPVLETARLQIRPFTREDLARCHAILDAGAGGDALAARQEWLEWTVRGYPQLARLFQPPYGDRAVVHRESGALIGACGLVPSLGPFEQLPSRRGDAASAPARATPEVGIYYALDAAHRGQGFATEAAEALIEWSRGALSLARIVATTTYDNSRSIRVMERLGMRVERNPLPEPSWFQIVGTLEL
jgi:[ribosomal protein S5]-alanine N-acetyltransferase